MVVTGLGAVSPCGIGVAENWTNVMAGRSGVGPITRFDVSEYTSRIAGEVKGFEPTDWIDKKDVKKMDVFIQYAIAATQMALEDADALGSYPAERVGVIIGSGIGGLPSIERQFKTLLDRGPSRISPFFIPGLIINLASGMVSIRWGLKGPNSAVSTACATGNHAIGEGYRLIAGGHADAMVTGGAEGVITPLAVGGFCAMRALSTRNEEPERASRPFDKGRDGFVMGEGSGILVLERLDRALERGAHIYAEVAGYGMSGDAFHISAPEENGDGAYRVMRNALEDGAIRPDEVDYVNAHGTSTPVGDRVETIALKRLFEDHATALKVSSTKSMTGHLLGAAGGLEAVYTVLAVEKQEIPPTINLDDPDPECDLDYVANEGATHPIRVALTNSFGFGGTNAALAFKRYER